MATENTQDNHAVLAVACPFQAATSALGQLRRSNGMQKEGLNNDALQSLVIEIEDDGRDDDSAGPPATVVSALSSTSEDATSEDDDDDDVGDNDDDDSDDGDDGVEAIQMVIQGSSSQTENMSQTPMNLQSTQLPNAATHKQTTPHTTPADDLSANYDQDG